VPELNWNPTVDRAAENVLILPTGPADEFESCSLFFVHAINQARQRLWITSPYFVPDSSVVNALQLAAMRGVDVRIMLPLRPDHLLVYLSSFSYVDEMSAANVKLYRYKPGFMHQKVLLIDDDIAAVGTANLDNRSFRLNFELTALVADRGFAGEVAAMLDKDFAGCLRVPVDDFRRRSLGFRLAVRAARLLAPLQ
jgi:cardiolipin synthase